MIDEKSIKNIYAAIGDEHSKKIFEKRLLFSLFDQEDSALSDIMEEFKSVVLRDERLLKLKKYLMKQDGNLYVFGCGIYARHMLELMPEIRIKNFIDNREDLDGESFLGYPVISFSKFMENYDGGMVVISSKPNYFEMYDQLIDAGVHNENIIDGGILWDIIEGKQYFDLPYLPHLKDECFVDVGSLDGLSCVAFVDWSGSESSKCFCFEPDQQNKRKTIHNLKRHNVQNYVLYEKGAWESNGELMFLSRGMGESRIVFNEKNSDKENRDILIKVPVVSLDSVLGEERITFIKMDIEGSEMPALRGAERIIRTQKPKLAICVYHKPEDIWEIPEYILKIRNDYKLYFRHYCYWGVGETVMYAI